MSDIPSCVCCPVFIPGSEKCFQRSSNDPEKTGSRVKHALARDDTVYSLMDLVTGVSSPEMADCFLAFVV